MSQFYPRLIILLIFIVSNSVHLFSQNTADEFCDEMIQNNRKKAAKIVAFKVNEIHLGWMNRDVRLADGYNDFSKWLKKCSSVRKVAWNRSDIQALNGRPNPAKIGIQLESADSVIEYCITFASDKSNNPFSRRSNYLIFQEISLCPGFIKTELDKRRAAYEAGNPFSYDQKMNGFWEDSTHSILFSIHPYNKKYRSSPPVLRQIRHQAKFVTNPQLLTSWDNCKVMFATNRGVLNSNQQWCFSFDTWMATYSYNYEIMRFDEDLLVLKQIKSAGSTSSAVVPFQPVITTFVLRRIKMEFD